LAHRGRLIVVLLKDVDDLEHLGGQLPGIFPFELLQLGRFLLRFVSGKESGSPEWCQKENEQIGSHSVHGDAPWASEGLPRSSLPSAPRSRDPDSCAGHRDRTASALSSRSPPASPAPAARSAARWPCSGPGPGYIPASARR